ncbi:MAG: dihydropteroate synthase [Paracoccaceae bacterium]
MNDAWTDRRDRFLTRLAERPQVMGILNITPDSFSDGGVLASVEAARAQAEAFTMAGCDVLDIGGESTRPGATPVGVEEELDRVLPVIEAVSGAVDLPISVDTYKAAVAREAVSVGAVIINEVWGLQKDPKIADVVAETEAAVIVMHNRTEVDPTLDIMADMRAFLTTSLDLARAAGVDTGRILVDPGIGFGRTPEQSLTCVRRLNELGDWFGLPVLLGLSRKRFIGHVLDRDVDDRLIGTLAANMVGIAKGARVIRVHDVAEHVEALRMRQAIEEAT